MLKHHQVVLGFLLSTASFAVILTLQSDPTGYGEICEYQQSGYKECTPHHIILVALWKTLKILNDVSVAITALATIFIARFTLRLKKSTDKLWVAHERQLELARNEFAATHQPILRVRWVTVGDIESHQVVVTFGIVNTGMSNATVLGSSVNAGYPPPTGWPNPHEYTRNDFIMEGRFMPGATDKYDFPLNESISLGDVFALQGPDLRFYGCIIYRDDLENTRATYFCRQYDRAMERFTPVDDPDYESID